MNAMIFATIFLFEIQQITSIILFPLHQQLDSNCSNNTALTLTEHHHDIDLVTTLRSELAALSYKKERLTSEVIQYTDIKY